MNKAKNPSALVSLLIAVGILAGLGMIGFAVAGGVSEPTETATTVVVPKQTEAAEPTETEPTKPKTTTPPAETPEPDLGLSSARENAVGKAEDYLDYTAFSKSGLAKQLEFEGYSTADANFAVEHIEVDWMEQAALSAKNYLEYTHFSRSGLIEQLEFEGFTSAQAEHGAKAAGL